MPHLQSDAELMATALDIPLADQIKCVRREIALRKRVYAKRVAAGILKQHTANHEIACMYAVLHLLLDTDTAELAVARQELQQLRARESTTEEKS